MDVPVSVQWAHIVEAARKNFPSPALEEAIERHDLRLFGQAIPPDHPMYRVLLKFEQRNGTDWAKDLENGTAH